jgi:hypothetical protein
MATWVPRSKGQRMYVTGFGLAQSGASFAVEAVEQSERKSGIQKQAMDWKLELRWSWSGVDADLNDEL